MASGKLKSIQCLVIVCAEDMCLANDNLHFSCSNVMASCGVLHISSDARYKVHERGCASGSLGHHLHARLTKLLKLSSAHVIISPL